MSKKHRPAAPEQQGKKKSGNSAAVVIAVILVVALIAVLTYQPSNRSTPMTQQPTVPAQRGAYDFVREGELRFLTPKQEFLSAIDIQIARDESRRELGLMYRDALAENQGMLFLFDDEEVRSFWMKNTVLPLDMIFVNTQNEIVTIHKNTTPYSEQSYESTKPAKYVVEVNAGYTTRHKISVGDHIAWGQF